MRAMTFAAALLATTLGHAAWAQSAAEHEGHHPDQKQGQATPKADQRAPAGSQGVNGGGMMGGKMPMMDMAKMMEMMRQSSDGMGMDTIDHIEGRVAFLRTELKITEAQQPAWNAFADALRANAKALGEIRGSMMSQQGAGAGLVEKLAFQEKWLAARLEGTRAMKSALTNLVSTFSDEQKKAADELLAPQMGMMPMMSAMQGGGTMGMGMQSGKPMQ
jgi:hypothetical protein